MYLKDQEDGLQEDQHWWGGGGDGQRAASTHVGFWKLSLAEQ